MQLIVAHVFESAHASGPGCDQANPVITLVSLADVDVAASDRPEDLVALDEALSRLEQIDPRASRVVELRFFTGLSEREAAEAMDISIATLKRDWTFAKAWLFDQLNDRDIQK